MKICYLRLISLEKTIGFTETLDLINYMAHKNHKVYVITLKSSKKKVKYKFSQNNVKVFQTPSLSSYIKRSRISLFINFLFYTLFSILIVFKIYLKERVRIIHFYPETAIPVFILSKVFKRICFILDTRIPILIQATEMEPNQQIKPLVSIFYILLEKLSISSSDFICAITEGVKNYLLERINLYNSNKRDIFILPCSVDLNLFTPSRNHLSKINNLREKLKISNEEEILLYLGSGSQIRDFDKVLNIFSKLLNKGYNFKLLILGELESKLRKYCEELEITSHVIIKNVPHNNLPIYIELADICISYLPNLLTFKYSCPLKTLEYMAMEKPVVATNILAHQELIKNEFTGILTKCNEADFLQAIVYLINHREEAKKLGNRGRKFVERKFTLDIIGYNYERFLNESKKLKTIK